MKEIMYDQYFYQQVKDVIQDFADRNRFTPLATATLLNETINKWNNRMYVKEDLYICKQGN